MPAKHELFVSHSSKDKAVATELCKELELRGFSCWIAPRDIDVGGEYSQSLNTAISHASIFLLLLSSNSDQSKHVRREVEIADRKGISILPVRLEDLKTFENLDYFVSAKQWCDIIARPVGLHLKALEETLCHTLGDPQLEGLWRLEGGHLANRYAVRRPRTLLSLDGGGVRGVITLEILARIEEMLALRSSDPLAFRLCHSFDFIAGSGSGGLIAIALARGISTRELLAFFVAHASEMFGQEVRPFESFLPTVPPPSPGLADSLAELIGQEATMSSESLQCLLMVLVRSQSLNNTPWPITNNPLAKYNQRERNDSNLRFPLLPLARASMTWSPLAGPEVFGSETSRTFRIGDGTFTPYANPAFLLYQTATSAAYRLKWNRGERNLLLVSIGSVDYYRGAREVTGSPQLEELLVPFMQITAVDQDIKCRTVGRCIHGNMIDREIGDLIPREKDGQIVPLSTDIGREFTYVRYQFPLDSRETRFGDLERTFDLRSESDLASLRDIGRLASESVSEEHFRAVRMPSLS